jgi:uncharacterized protein YqjF (DUF2071 family)
MDDIISMNWSKVLFMNLEVDKDHLRAHIPSELEIRTHNNKSYISLVFFNLEGPGIDCFNIPLSLSEFNIRTYVRYKSFEGIYFLTLDVNNCLLPIFVNKIFKLNYHNNSIDYNTENNLKRVNWTNRKFNLANFSFHFKVRESMQTSSYSNFITENYLYLSKPKNSIYYNKVYHKKWDLNHVDLHHIKNLNLFEENLIHSAFYGNQLKVRTGFPVKLT